MVLSFVKECGGKLLWLNLLKHMTSRRGSVRTTKGIGHPVLEDALHTQVCDTLVGTHPYTCLRSGRDGRVGGVGPRHLLNTSALELVHVPEAGAGLVLIEVRGQLRAIPSLHTSSC